jgi:tetratricopeptide (TPR) repeat protein
MKRFFQPGLERVINRDSGKLAQKIIAIALVVALLVAVHVPAIVILFVVGAGVLIMIAVQRSQRRKTDLVFAFYVAADEVLCDEERRYRFEVADAIKAGEKVASLLPDPPPLSSFALGALYYSVGDHNAAVEHLALAAEEQILKDSIHKKPSRRLRRYVARLRQIERAPQRFSRVNAAMQNLQRLHRDTGARLLAESQHHLKKLVEAYANDAAEQNKLPPRNDGMISPARQLNSITAPPPISQVLNDVYQEEATSS